MSSSIVPSGQREVNRLGRDSASERLALSVTEVALALGLSRSSVYQMIRRGELRSVKLGARRVIPASEIARLLGTGQGGA